ncbi:MAG: RHS repeat-associated core domain-containing protein [Anaerolineae bacterium]|nr:RHS repeat-associated core domain-containing protein [Anaerolineae bacterium]
MSTNRSAESLTSTLLYTYTADGLRVAQSVQSVPESVDSFAWDWASGLPEVLAQFRNLQSANPQSLYLYGLDLVAQQQSDAWQYPLGDSLGSVRQWTDEEGTVTYAAGYTPFGEELWRAGSAASAWGFTGEWQDPDVGLLYLRARWYDGATGRFTQADPFPFINKWLYANADPVNRVDPTGYFGQHTLARSLGVGNFDEVIRIFREEYHIPWTEGRSNEISRWGLLRLMQEAKCGDSLKGVFVGVFGVASMQSLGSQGSRFQCVNGEIWVGQENLQSLLDRVDAGEYLQLQKEYGGYEAPLTYWRDPLALYYLNGQSFRDGNGSSLPDWATIYLDVSIPGASLAGLNFAYTIDRYGHPYGAIEYGIGLNLSPGAVGYYESYLNYWPWQGKENRAANEAELKAIIPGLSSSATLLGGVFTIGGELNWDYLEQWVGTVGLVFLQGVVDVGIVGYTFPLPDSWSLNPDGWWWVDAHQGYEEKDIPLQWDSEECGC